MRWLARLFIALFCISFIANQATSQDSSPNNLLISLWDFATKGITMCVYSSSLNSERLNNIEIYMANTMGYKPKSIDFSNVKDSIEQYQKSLDVVKQAFNQE